MQVARRPDDRRWLRASATHLILDESGLTDPTRTLGVSRADAGRAAALLLARVDAGILNPDEVEPVARVVTDVLGVDTLATLREIWTAAHATPDDDAQAMIDLGRRWCDALGARGRDRHGPRDTGRCPRHQGRRGPGRRAVAAERRDPRRAAPDRCGRRARAGSRCH